MARTKRPSVTVSCVADHYHAPTQRIIEFSFPSGNGGLISFSTKDDGTDVVEVYRTDPGVRVEGDRWNDRESKSEVRTQASVDAAAELAESVVQGFCRYDIVRYFHPSQDKPSKVIQRNVSLEEAQRHCQDPRTKRDGQYFDGYRRAAS